MYLFPHSSIRRLMASLTMLVMLTLAGCGATPAAMPEATIPASAAPTTVAPTGVGSPVSEPTGGSVTAPPIEVATPLPTMAADPVLADALEAIVVANLVAPGLAPDGTGSGGYDGVVARPLSNDPENRWLVASYGMRSFDPMQNHFVAIYSRTGDSWQEVARTDIQSADYLSEASITEAAIAPGRQWLVVEGGVGAHGGCFEVLSLEGATLQSEYATCGVSPGIGRLSDLDGDTVPEIVIDASDPYVFCYACGVRTVAFEVQRWDGAAFQPVRLSPLPEGAPEAARRALTFAEAGLWHEAELALGSADAAALTEPTAQWNSALIRLHTQAGRDHVANSGYPLLAALFLGDYTAARETLRERKGTDFIGADSPMLVNTPAESFGPQLGTSLRALTERALPLLADQPTKAAMAYFLRAWGTSLENPGNPSIVADLQQATTLDPNDQLYKEFLAVMEPTGDAAPTAGAVLPHPLIYLTPDGQIGRLERDGITASVLTEESERISDFDVSPTDGAIAYVSGLSLYRIDSQGGNRTLLVESPAGNPNGVVFPRWSPDGQQIAYGLEGVNVIPATGGTPRQLIASSPMPDPMTDIPADTRFYNPMSWSPDGQKLAISVGYFPHGGYLGILSLADGTLVDATGGPSELCCDAFWSPDSRELFIANPHPGMIEVGLWRIDAESGKTTFLLNGMPQRQGAPFTVVGFPFPRSATEMLVFFNPEAGEQEVFSGQPLVAPARLTISGDSTQAEPLRTEPLRVFEALWAPDGTGAVVVDGLDATYESGGAMAWIPASDSELIPLEAMGRELRWGR